MNVLALVFLVFLVVVVAVVWFLAKVVRVLNRVEADLDAKVSERQAQV